MEMISSGLQSLVKEYLKLKVGFSQCDFHIYEVSVPFSTLEETNHAEVSRILLLVCWTALNKLEIEWNGLSCKEDFMTWLDWWWYMHQAEVICKLMSLYSQDPPCAYPYEHHIWVKFKLSSSSAHNKNKHCTRNTICTNVSFKSIYINRHPHTIALLLNMTFLHPTYCGFKRDSYNITNVPADQLYK